MEMNGGEGGEICSDGEGGDKGIYFILTHLCSYVTGAEDDDDENKGAGGSRSKGGLSHLGKLQGSTSYTTIVYYT
jgi:hypothetical protein